MKEKGPVVISGIGIFTPETKSINCFFKKIKKGEKNSSKEFNISRKELSDIFYNSKDIRFAKKSLQYSMGALKNAWEDSNLGEPGQSNYKIGIFCGEFMEYKQYLPCITNFLKEGDSDFDSFKYTDYIYRRLNSFEMLKNVPNIPSYIIASNYKINGPALTYLNGCSSGATALLEGFQAIKNTDIDIAVIVSGSARINILEKVFFERSGFFGEEDFSIGECGTAIILEKMSSALSRELIPYAKILGGGSTIVDLTNDEITYQKIYQLINSLFNKLNLKKNQLNYINEMFFFSKYYQKINDRIKDQLIEDQLDIQITSLRELFGHTFASSGLIETIGCLSKLLNSNIALINTVGLGGFSNSLFLEGLL